MLKQKETQYSKPLMWSIFTLHKQRPINLSRQIFQNLYDEILGPDTYLEGEGEFTTEITIICDFILQQESGDMQHVRKKE